MPLREFLELLSSLKNKLDYLQDPKGKSLIAFLREKTGLSGVTVKTKVDELTALGYLKKELYKSRLWRIKILQSEWDETRSIEAPPQEDEREPEDSGEQDPSGQTPADTEPVTETAEPAPDQEEAAATPPESLPPGTDQPTALQTAPAERTFAIFMDYKNLEDNLKNADRFRNFSWLLDPILAQGKIIFAFVFIPDHYFTRAPIQQLSNLHRFQVIACPRQIGGAITKDADTVDAKIDELAWPIVEHTDVSDLIIISGDADFKRLANLARWRRKKVTVISAPKAVSGRFFEMEKAGTVHLQLIG
jgi:hypothetical protein